MALIFESTQLSDWDSKVETGGSVTEDTDWGTTIKFTGDGTDTGTQNVYVQKAISPASQELLIHLIVETGHDFDIAHSGYWRMLQLLDSSDNMLHSIYVSAYASETDEMRLWATSKIDGGTTKYTQPGGTIKMWEQNGETPPHARGYGSMYELWFVWKKDSGATDGYFGFGGNTGARWGTFMGLASSTTADVAKIRFGAAATGESVHGSLYLHKLEVFDARVADLEFVNGGHTDYYEGTHVVLDIDCGTETDAFDPAADTLQLSYSSNYASPIDLTIAGLPLSGERIDTRSADASLISTLFDVADNTYEACFVEPTFPTAGFFPPCLIARQIQGTGQGTAYLTRSGIWLATEPKSSSDTYYTTDADGVDFDLWQVKHIGGSVYRVAIPGRVVRRGGNYVRLTIDGVNYDTSFTAQARPRGTLNYRQGWGRHLAIGYDDGTPTQPAQERTIWKDQSVKPYIGVPFGLANVCGAIGWGIVDKLIDTGWTVACHGWSGTTFGSYTYAEAIEMLDILEMISLTNGMPCAFFYPGGGVFYTSDSTTGYTRLTRPILDKWDFTRGSTSAFCNDIPLDHADYLDGLSISNDDDGSAGAVASAALRVATILAAGDDTLAVLQAHVVGDNGTTECEIDYITELISQAAAAGIDVVNIGTFYSQVEPIQNGNYTPEGSASITFSTLQQGSIFGVF